MKILDSSVKLITQVGKVFEYPKNYPLEMSIKNVFQIQMKNLTDSNQINISRHKIESTLTLNKSQHGNENIMVTL